MSILSDAASGKITWDTAAAQAAAWVGKAFGLGGANVAPAVVAQAGAVLTDLKQTISDTIGLADTLAGPILSTGALAVETAADKALASLIGPGATIITPAIDSAIAQGEATLVAAIHARALALRASLAPVSLAATSGGAGGTILVNTGAGLG